jgi:hypothetical protein
MTQEIEDPAARGTRAGPGECSLLGGENSPQNKPDPRLAQAQKIDAANDLALARRDLLREFIFEKAGEAAHYLATVQAFVAADDSPGLAYSARKFVAIAREVARSCRQLLGSEKGGDE